MKFSHILFFIFILVTIVGAVYAFGKIVPMTFTVFTSSGTLLLNKTVPIIDNTEIGENEWIITKTGAEEKLDIAYEIINETTTIFTITTKD